MSDSSSVLFLHIPKTAGTSLRLGAVKALGAEQCYFDYGRKAPDTSELVRKYAYEEPDLFALKSEMDKAGGRFFCGHFDYRRYGPLFPIDRILSFCRDPAQQLLSHHAHAVRLNGYKGSLANFLTGTEGGGRQSRAFQGAPLEMIGFIGVTERYDDSLRVIKEAYGLDIERMVWNANPTRKAAREYDVPPSAAPVLADAVAKDAALYERANELLNQRLVAIEAGYPFVHGAIQDANREFVRGYAYDRSTEPVVIELQVNGETVASRAAIDDRPGLRGFRAPRNGYIGFYFRHVNFLEPGDQVVVKVASTGQELGRYVADDLPKDAGT